MKKSLIIGVLFILGWVALSSSMFIVSEEHQYVITRFGKPVKEIRDAGLNFKVPFIEKAVQIEKRIVEWDGYPNQIPTRDKKYIIVDTTARWRITNPTKFLETVRTPRGAQSRLDDIIDSATREAISSHNLVEAVRNTNRILEERTKKEKEEIEESAETEPEHLELKRIYVGRDKLQRGIFKSAAPTIKQYGIELIDVRIKRLNYEKSVQKKVFDRMISERKSIAEKLRSEGFGKKAEINGRMNRELDRIQSEAYKKAQLVKGKADAESTSIYAEGYNRDPEFYNFTRTLEAYRKTLDDKVTLFLDTDGEFLELLND